MLIKLSWSVIGFKYKFLSSLFCVERPTQLQRKVNCCSLLLAERLVGCWTDRSLLLLGVLSPILPKLTTFLTNIHLWRGAETVKVSRA